MTYLLLAIGLGLLAWGGDTLVNGAVGLAHRMGVSTLLIGLTLVGFGTSSPELVSSLIAVFQDSPGIAVGNVIGSNIANILLVLGAAAVIAPVKIDTRHFSRDGTFLSVATLLLVAAICIGRIDRALAIVLVLTLVVYLIYSYISDRREQSATTQKELSDEKPTSMPMALIKTVGGIALTILGAQLLVDNAIILARTWGVSEAVIGLTIVAVGTSLPELATSVISSLRGHNDVAFGNVVGSNIYNALFILGVTAIFAPIGVPDGLGWDAALMLVLTAMLVAIAIYRKCFSRGIGLMFLAIYAAYTINMYLMPAA